MRYGIIPARLSERLALWLGRVPVPIADCLLPLLQTRSLMAAVRLGIVDAIGDGEASADDIARMRGLDADAVEMLLRVLVSARYVSIASRSSLRAQTGYRLSPLGLQTLLPASPASARGYVQWNFVQWDLIEELERVLRTGRGMEFHGRLQGDENWKWYQQAMLDLARAAAPILARLVPVKRGARTLVDIGGSHGLLGAAICRKHPPMRSIVLELPAAVGEARAAAQRAGVDDVVQHRAGSVLEDGVPADADVVLLANVVHHFTRHDAIAVLRKARDAMTAGGTVAIWDFDRPASGASPELAADATALYFRLTSTSQVVPGDEYGAWLREVGFRKVQLKRSVFAPFQVLALGIR
jgi:hypothetical protein